MLHFKKLVSDGVDFNLDQLVVEAKVKKNGADKKNYCDSSTSVTMYGKKTSLALY